MINAANEIKEISMMIDAFGLPVCDGSVKICMDRITSDIEEDFLMERAEIIRSNTALLLPYLEKLASICNKDAMNCQSCPVRKYCNTNIKNLRAASDKARYKMIDLFCGAGGLSLGFFQEGFFTSFANDIQECCIDTYAHNHPETPRKNIILGDIKTVLESNDIDITEPIEIIIGGPPCQGFSEANRQRLIDDPRNELYKYFVGFVKRIRPLFFVMENVKGMQKVKHQVIEDFEKIGYNVSAQILNAKDFGVPQNRERLIYIGNRIGVNSEECFDELLKLRDTIPSFVLSDALFGLRPLEAMRTKNSTDKETEGSGKTIERNTSGETNAYIELINQGKSFPFVLNHKARYNNDRDIEIFGRLDPGDRSDDPKIADIMPYKRRNDIFKDKYYKLEPNKVCKTITAHMKFDCNMYIHPSQARGLTPREAARVQSYPDDYFFRGAYTKTYMQIGNSVPPLLGRAIAKVIKRYIDSYYEVIS